MLPWELLPPQCLQPGPLWAAGSPAGPLWLWKLWQQDPGPQGGEGAHLRPGAQLSDALPQVKGKFKHGGGEALVDEVPGQAALEICIKDPDEGADAGVTGCLEHDEAPRTVLSPEDRGTDGGPWSQAKPLTPRLPHSGPIVD